jgi:DNA-binding FadR family transcriptional regulator
MSRTVVIEDKAIEDKLTSDLPLGSPNLRFHRLGAKVADHLRDRILRGDLLEAGVLPKEADLRQHYPVSKPTLREAMRILESEGLITIRRGNVGGAMVHRPTSSNVAYTLGLVLVSKGVRITDVAGALREVEPACAALCALRSDRARTVLPTLRRLHKQSVDQVDDLVATTTLSRRFHEAMVDLCNNQTLTIMAGALETLWSSHESEWAHRVADLGKIPVKERLEVLDEHQKVIDYIARGDATMAREAATAHLARSQAYPSRPNDRGLIDPVAVREWTS